MLQIFAAAFLAAMALAVPPADASVDTVSPVNLRCEYKVDPLGIGERLPRLSWELRAANPSRRGQSQTAYQILAASTQAKLDAEEGDLWDTGKVESRETNQIVYAGRPLGSRAGVWWKVRSWNEQGEVSPWGPTARWTVGLLDPGDWQAKWIGYDTPAPGASDPSTELDLKGARWVWHSAMNEPATTQPNATVERRVFRGDIEVPAGRKIKRATFLLTADDRAEVYVNGVAAGRATTWRRLHRLDVTTRLRGGRNVVAISVENDAGSPAGLVGRLRVEFEEGEPVESAIDRSWKVAATEQAGWQSAEFDDAGWAEAANVATMGDAPWGTVGEQQTILPPPPQLRKAFLSDKPVRRATLYASALGLYDLYLNGRRMGNVEFAPGWTEYRKRVYYHAYDVTPHVRVGTNALATLLGDGWYAGYVGYGHKRDIYGNKPRLLAQLEIEYVDGTTQTVVTDESWQADYGPVREADFLMGCTYDAREERPWMRADFDDSEWKQVAVGSDFKGALEAYPGAPTRRQEELPGKAVTERLPGVYVIDVGQNMVGWARVKGRGKAGQAVTIRYAEMLEPDGSLYTVALRGARATDTYIPSRDGEFEFEPVFTFHGFQFVEVAGLDAPPEPADVTGIVVNADIGRTGFLATSSPPVNQLVHNIIWGQKGNYLEVPTDCPQRDERLGWTGDAQFFMRTACYNFDVAAFFTKWLVDLNQDAQNADGAYASVAPDVLDFSGAGATGWADAGIICPYAIWQFYGDTRVIEQQYDSMARYIDYLERTSENLIRTQGAYGDWVNLGGGAKSEVIGTAYFAHVVYLMSEMAAAVGKQEDAARYRELAGRVREVFIREFVSADGRIMESSQTGYALAFTMDLLPPGVRAAAAERFVEEIAAKDWHLATGFIGTPRLLPALTAAGRTEVAYRLLLTETYPSWLFQVKLGATTMWERWDGWTPEKGFQTPTMNSFNHYAFGSVGEWLYDTAAGIRSDGPGFRRIVIAPQPGPGLTSMSGRYDSINGRIVADWRIDGGRIVMNVQVPVNTTAVVVVPGADPATVTEGGRPAAQAEGVRRIHRGEGTAAFEIGSGSYEFAAPFR